MKVRVAEVSYEGKIVEYLVVADDNVHARDLIVRYLGDDERKSIRVRSTEDVLDGPARVIGKNEPIADR